LLLSNKKNMNAFLKLLPNLRPYRWQMGIVILSTLGVTAMSLVTPWLIRELIRIIRTAESDGSGRALGWLAAGLLVAYFLYSLCRYLSSYVAHYVAWNFVSDIQGIVYAHLQTMSPRYYADKQTGEIMSRVTSDTQDLEPMIAHTIPDTIVNVLLIIGVCTILFSLNVTLTLITLVTVPVLFYFLARFGAGEYEGFKRALRNLGEFRARVQDNLSGMKEIQIFTQESYEGQRIGRLAKNHTDERIYALKMQALIPASVEMMAGVGTVLIVWLGGRLAMQGQMPIEDLVAFLLYLGILYQPIRAMAYMHEGFQTAAAGASRVGEVLALQSEVASPADALDPGRLNGHIAFKNVSFAYLSDIPVLQDISVEVRPGQKLALVGATGVGKSTIAGLVPRFYDPQAGQILIDGVDARQLSLPGLRRNISMVLQDVFLFNGTVRENLRFSKPEATDEEIVAAAKIANAHPFIQSLPNGYETQIGERGIKLSGGQKQRLSIARAVLKDAPILILDEATSSVDAQTEAEIQEALEKLMAGRTSIVIAHRLSTVRDADVIVVLEEGRIAQVGNHNHLVRHDGLYQKLYHRQYAHIGVEPKLSDLAVAGD
jgi:ATP-binding cassette subfamily B protein/subfamily B ATP-binding cassette protein MsbA